MATIRLVGKHSRGREVRVDDDMVDYLGQWRWYCMPDLYARTSRRCSDGSWRSMAMHRLILDAIDSHLVVDHINRDKLDNRRSNLRLVESVINRQNTGSFGGSSVFRGVYWEASKRRWRARIMLNGKKYALGYFGDERDAALAVETFRAERMPWVAPDNALAEQKWWPPRGKLRFIEAAEWPS